MPKSDLKDRETVKQQTSHHQRKIAYDRLASSSNARSRSASSREASVTM